MWKGTAIVFRWKLSYDPSLRQAGLAASVLDSFRWVVRPRFLTALRGKQLTIS